MLLRPGYMQPLMCALWAEVLSFLAAPFFPVSVLHPCSDPHDQPQNDRTEVKTGRRLKSTWAQAREHCALSGSSKRKQGQHGNGMKSAEKPGEVPLCCSFQSQVKGARAEMGKGQTPGR